MAACLASTQDERVRLPSPPYALVAQLAERHLAKVKAAGSMPAQCSPSPGDVGVEASNLDCDGSTPSEGMLLY